MRRAPDTLAVFAVASAVYLLSGQRTFYGVDGWRLVRRIASGDVRSDMHLLYKPLARLAVRCGEVLGLSVYESVVAASAIGTAVGVALIHLAARVLGASRRDALLVAAAAGLFPAVLFFATVVERHGPFFAFAGATALASAWVARAPSISSGAGFALACTAAYAAHSTGILMVAAFLPMAVAWARTGVGRAGPAAWRAILVAVAVAAVGTALGTFLARRAGVWLGSVEREGDNLAFFLQHAAAHVGAPEQLPVCAWNEVIVAFAPMSLLWLLVWRDVRPSLVGWATTIAVAVYLGFSFLILGDFDERGAYALPLAWPLAWVAVRRLQRWLSLAAVLLAAALAVAQVARHDDRHLDGWGRGLQEVAGTGIPYLPVAAPVDFELLFLHQPDARPQAGYYDAFDTHGFDAEIVRELAPALIAFLGTRHDAGKTLVLSQMGREALEEPADPGKAGPLVLEVLERGFVFEPVQAGDFEGFRLVPRR